ncbi:MAG: efflux RND transporter periplasmic adaptor subunit, partial [Burkholderiales bacterium]|nr:efflux RND transporter periplasmic adaptor subunit [Burkholderiales bacterium]
MPRNAPAPTFVALRLTLALALLGALSPAPAEARDPAAASGLATAEVRSERGAQPEGYDGVVQAVRQTVVAAQVAGAVVALDVHAGDRVRAGQVLLRLDARSAEQAAQAGDAQVQAARAQLDTATRSLERQQSLYRLHYISQAALEQAESAFKATRALVRAQLAQAGVARTQTGLHVVRAPYAGVVAEVPVALGDMALPGRPLLSLYDPQALRVSAAVPQSVALHLSGGPSPVIELPGLPAAQRLPAAAWQVLPTVDPATHTVEVRAVLPADLAGVGPGQFARLWLTQAGGSDD